MTLREVGATKAVHLARGAILEWTGGRLVVADVGPKPHSNGFGPCDFRAFQLTGSLRAGDILSTPWGSCEVVDTPRVCRIARQTWDGKLKFGAAGSSEAIASTLAAAKAMGVETNRFVIDFEG